MDISFSNKLRFYSNYALYKFILIWTEVRQPKLKLFLIELTYSFGKLFKPLETISYYIKVNYLETKFGSFYLRPGTMDVICASPAFERRDVDCLLNLLTDLRKKGKNILFIDAGADFGSYSILVGNHLKRYKKLSIFAFEPVPESFSLLKRNVQLNKLERKTTLHNLALMSKSGYRNMSLDKINPGANEIVSSHDSENIRIQTQSLDFFQLYNKRFDVVIMKVDVQGQEKDLLKGSLLTLNKIPESYILIEDCFEPDIFYFLVNNKFTFLRKITTYNSWWKLH